MSREKSEKDVRNVPITVRLNEEEHEKLKRCVAACGLSAAEFMRQLCKGNAPQPQPKIEFWDLFNKLYEVYDAFKKCVPYYPTAKDRQTYIENAHTPIIDRDLWEKVQMIRENKRRPTKSDMTSIFSGLLYCADCGAKLSLATANGYAHFRCSEKKDGNGHSKSTSTIPMSGLWTSPRTRKCGKWNRNICSIPNVKPPKYKTWQEKIYAPSSTYLFLSLSGLTHHQIL